MSERNVAISEKDKDILFRDARTYNGWLDKDVSDEQIKEIYDLMIMGPTSANCLPMRMKFLKTEKAKKRLEPHLAEGNRKKTMAAPVIAVLAYDMKFYEHLPRLFPHTDAKSWFEHDPDAIYNTARRNGTLQQAYLIMAARSVGLDCGPMSGFDADGVKGEFFKEDNVIVDLVCNIGYGDESTIFERSPRFDFGDISEIL